MGESSSPGADPAFLPAALWDGFFDPVAMQDPWPSIAALGEHAACSHAAASVVLRDARFTAPDAVPSDRPMWQMFHRWVLNADGERHATLRRAVSRAFTKTAVQQYEPLIEVTVKDLLDGLIARGEMDLLQEFAFPLPTRVITTLMGLSADERDGLDTLVADLSTAFVRQREEAWLDRGDEATVELLTRMDRILRNRRERPGDDLLSRLVSIEEESATVDHDDLVANAVFLFQAGHDTTMNTVTSAVHALLTHPEQMALVVADPELVPSTVQEVLRFHSAIGIAPRQATADVELPQGVVRAGSTMSMLLGAVNRDPSVFPDPHRFDITRERPPHVAFSAGPHRCAGAPLATREVEIALAALLRRLPGLRLVSEPRWTGVVPFRGLDSLHVAWTPPPSD